MDLEKIKNNKIKYRIIATFAFLLLFLGYNSVDAATLRINSNSATLSPGNIMTLSVILDSQGVAINNADAKILFPKDLLEVVSINKSNSIFSLWVEEPSYSNFTGVVTFNGGLPTPGFNGSQGTAISIVVKAKTTGQADILFSDASIRANDGFGTDVLNSKTGKTITISKKEEPLAEEAPLPVALPTTALSLQVTSATHPSQELWYKDNNPTFKWKVPTGVDAVQTSIDDSIAESPRVTYVPVIDQKSIKNLKDGTWYFKVRARKSGKWGPTTTYIARIDKTIPDNKNVIFSYDDTKKVLNISADIVDETSGLDYYEIYVNDSLVNKVPTTDFVGGNYSFVFDTPGDNTVKLVAVDRAGNSVESSGSFKATSPAPESVKQNTDKQLLVSIGSFSIPLLSFIVGLLSIILILVIGAFKLGVQHKRSNMRTSLINGDNTKALILLKKRLEKHLEMLQRTRHKRILLKEEKEIKEAIESDLDEVDKAIAESSK